MVAWANDASIDLLDNWHVVHLWASLSLLLLTASHNRLWGWHGLLLNWRRLWWLDFLWSDCGLSWHHKSLKDWLTDVGIRVLFDLLHLALGTHVKVGRCLGVDLLSLHDGWVVGGTFKILFGGHWQDLV